MVFLLVDRPYKTKQTVDYPWLGKPLSFTIIRSNYEFSTCLTSNERAVLHVSFCVINHKNSFEFNLKSISCGDFQESGFLKEGAYNSKTCRLYYTYIYKNL